MITLPSLGANPIATAPQLQVAGQTHTGWTALQVSRGLEYCAGAFRLSLTERWPERGPGAAPFPFSAGQTCVLTLAGAPVISGSIDAVSRMLSAAERRLEVCGRDATAQLVDCSATLTRYQDQTLRQIAEAEIKAAGWTMQVATNGDVAKSFARAQAQPGDSVWQFLEGLARQRGALVMPDGTNLLLGSPRGNPAGDDVAEGRNILSIEVRADWRERFSEIEVRGQSAGSDERSGAEAAHIKASARDPGMQGPTRRLLITAEDGGADLQTRADWEVRHRAAMALQVDVTVQGWRAGALLWAPGQTVRVSAPSVGVVEELLVSDCEYSLDERGTLTRLRLARRGAFESLAEAPAKGADSGDWTA